MKVLMKVTHERDDAENANELAKRLFHTLSDAYNDQAGDREAYLHGIDYDDDAAEEMSLIDGKEQPRRIIEEAEKWNQIIESCFHRALVDLYSNAPREMDGRPRWLEGNSQLIYALKKATVALDDSFYEFAEYALFIKDAGYFTSIIEQAELSEIRNHPENFAIVTVYPK